MKVLHFLQNFGYGGTPHMVLNHCLALPSGTAGVVMFKGPFTDEFVKHGIPHVAIDGKFKSDTAAQISELASGADIINYHTSGEWHFNDVVKSLDIPVVVTLHGNFKLPKIPWPIICVAEHVQKRQLAENHSYHVPNGIFLPTYTPDQSKPPKSSERPVVIRVCRADRCADMFWPAMESVIEGTNCEVWIVGQAGISWDRVKYLGRRTDVPALLKQADVFAYAPAPAAGGAHDLCVIEAMASGVPPVVTDYPCVSASVENNRSGIIVPGEDTAAFADAVAKLVRDPILRKSLAEGALNRVRRDFDIRIIVKRYCEIYAECISKSSSVLAG